MVSLYILKHKKTEEQKVKRLTQHARALQRQSRAAAYALHALRHTLIHYSWDGECQAA